MMKNGSDAFERALRDSLEPYEVPYNSADWTQLEKELKKEDRAGWKTSAGLLALLFGGTLAVATTVYFVATSGTGTDKSVVMTTPAVQSALVEATDPTTRLVATSTEAASDLSYNQNNAGSTAPPTTAKPVVVAKNDAGLAQSGANYTDNGASRTPTSTEVLIKPSVVQGCPGASVEFTAANLPNDGTFLWNFGDGSFSRDPRPKHTFSKAGHFEVMLSHSSVGGGTIQNKPVSDVIVIHEIPEASFNMLKQEYDNTIPSVHFENRSIGGQCYVWDFGDGGTSTISHPSHVFKKSGTYAVSLVVTNGAGCTDRIEKTIHIDEDYNLLAAKTFSPNADGLEDTFIPEALKTLGVHFHMSVHNAETGELIYETKDAQRPWNGRVGGRGEQCTAGDYIWMVEMKDGEKLGGSYNGTVTLLR